MKISSFRFSFRFVVIFLGVLHLIMEQIFIHHLPHLRSKTFTLTKSLMPLNLVKELSGYASFWLLIFDFWFLAFDFWFLLDLLKDWFTYCYRLLLLSPQRMVDLLFGLFDWVLFCLPLLSEMLWLLLPTLALLLFLRVLVHFLSFQFLST